MAKLNTSVANDVSEPPLLETKFAKRLLAMTPDELDAYHIAQARRMIADGNESSRKLLQSQVNAMNFGPIVLKIIQLLIQYPSFAEPTRQFLEEKLALVASAIEAEVGSNGEAGN